ncbi:MAG: hypothetical protein H6740_13920 [Alphaproteobacteria bacterium]|nr:hypothetical protein [Alphaproteobacteria bacterium]
MTAALEALLAPFGEANFAGRCWDESPMQLPPDPSSSRPPPISSQALAALVGAPPADRTLRLLDPERGLPALERWAAPLRAAFPGLSRLAAVLAPAESPVSPISWSADSAFLLQVEGRSLWRIWAPIQRHPWPSEAPSAGARPEGEPIGQVALEPGGALYLPRGFVAGAVSLAERSLHLELRVTPTTHRDLLRAALLRMEDPRLELAVPHADGALEDEDLDVFEELLERLVDEAGLSPALALPSSGGDAAPILTWRALALEALARFDDPLARHALKPGRGDELDALRFAEVKERFLEMADAEEALEALLQG